MAAPRRPWYAFLYTLLGAQGSFFAWVIALLGIYVTFQEALLWAVNPAPVEARVADVVREVPRWRRWVRVGGVEIDLASALFAARGRRPAEQPRSGSEGGSDRILIDRDDPAAIAWRDAFREIEALRGDLEGAAADDETVDRIKRLRLLLIQIGAGGARGAYVPERALVVIARDEPSAEAAAAPPAAPAPTGGESLADVLRRDTRPRVELIRSAVRIDVSREGILERLPESRRASYGVAVAGAALGVGHRPSTVAAGLFALFTVTLLFLIIGLKPA